MHCLSAVPLLYIALTSTGLLQATENSRCKSETLDPNVTYVHEKYNCTCIEQPFTIDCTGSGLTTIPDDLLPYRVMIFDRNNITALNATNYPSVENISLEYNAISRIDNGTFSSMEHLVRLSLAHNQLNAIFSSVFRGLSELREFVCDFNKITRINSGTFNGEWLRSLRSISLSGCLIYRIEAESFRNTRNLTYLDLSQNFLTEVPVFGSFNGSLLSLKHLNLSRNNISFIGASSFKYLPALQLLDLRFNLLGNLGVESFGGLESSLTTLLLSHNGIDDLRDGLLNQLKLSKLDLSSNLLKSVDEKYINWANLSVLLLYGNPWHCVHSNSLIKQAYAKLNISVICSSPPEFTNRSSAEFLEVDERYCCNGLSVAAVIAIITTFILVTSVVIAVLYRQYRRKRESNRRRQKLPDALYPDAVSYSKMKDGDWDDEIVF